MPKISVIVPVYNAEKYLHRCIDSILAQTFTDFELLLIDDGSKDGSGKICDEYVARDGRVRVFHKPNGGVSSARNLGLDNATGEWIAFIDSDDWVSVEYLKKMIDAVVASDVDIVFSDFYFSDSSVNRLYKLYSWKKQGIEGLNDYIASVWTCLWGNIHKKFLYTYYKQKCPEGISYCEDFHLIVRLCYKARKINKVDEPLYFYRQQEASVMHNLNKKTEKDEQWVYADIVEFFKQEGVYKNLKKVLAWRKLKASQELALDILTFEEFKSYAIDAKPFVFSCPYIGKKLQFIMWCLLNDWQQIASAIVKIRKLLNR